MVLRERPFDWQSKTAVQMRSLLGKLDTTGMKEQSDTEAGQKGENLVACHHG